MENKQKTYWCGPIEMMNKMLMDHNVVVESFRPFDYRGAIYLFVILTDADLHVNLEFYCRARNLAVCEIQRPGKELMWIEPLVLSDDIKLIGLWRDVVGAAEVPVEEPIAATTEVTTDVPASVPDAPKQSLEEVSEVPAVKQFMSVFGPDDMATVPPEESEGIDGDPFKKKRNRK